MSISNTLKAFEPSILIGSAIVCGIAYAIKMLPYETKYDKAVNQKITNRFDESHESSVNLGSVYDSEGYDKYEYNAEGFCHSEYDVESSGKDMFNIKGFDRSNRNRRYYMNYLAKLYR